MSRPRIVAFSPIRLNSQRVPEKNIRMLGGQPLMCHMLNTLAQVDAIDEVYVYCSTDEIKQYLPERVKFLKRPKALDGHQTLGAEIYDAFVNTIEADYYLLAHTTSPFTRKKTIEDAIEKVVVTGAYDSALTVRRIQTFTWFEGKPLNYSLANVPRTQDIEPVFAETSAFFLFRRDLWLTEKRRVGNTPYFVEVSPIEAVDIDTMEDFDFAASILKNLYK